ncbi:hypothetical protein HR12_25840 [Microbacterium sp. SUBG005]|nr:hypothetical protein HR12_25840 [Microbacterium sp. SUBG005]
MWAPPGCHPRGGPLLQADHGGERIGEVRLQHDAGLDPVELGLAQQRFEDGEGEVEVLELLHVEVEEGPGLLRDPVQGPEGCDASATAASNAHGVCGATVEDTLIET